METIKLEKTDSVAKITFSKPPLNILNAADFVCLEKILKELRKDKNLKLIVFDSDQKVFSAGVDIDEHRPEKISEVIKAFNGMFLALIESEIPTLALVKALCAGGGSEFALFCDFVLASENACFAQPEIKLGCFPPLSIVHLPYLTGNKKALELILTGEKISAKEALKAGLVNHVFSEEEFEEKISKFIDLITYNSSAVIRSTLKTYKKINYSDLKEKIELAEKVFVEELVNLEDYSEGIDSFFEKRPPEWKGR